MAVTRLAILIGLVVLAGIVLFAVIGNRPEKGPPVGRVTGAPIPGGEVVLLVSGWSEVELDTILTDFSKIYDLRADSFRVTVGEKTATQIRISQSIASDVLAYLVNYLHYPKDLSLDDRRVAAIAIVQRSEALGGPRELAGRRATIYVPADDTEFDQVFVSVDPFRYFRISFTRLQWRPVDDGREPSAMQDLVPDHAH